MTPRRSGSTPSPGDDWVMLPVTRKASVLSIVLAAAVGSATASSPVVEAACWAHVRRKFFDFHKATQSPIAKEALDRIGALYAIENEIRGRPSDERRAVRQARAGPLLADLHTWFIPTVRKLSKTSELAGAIRYALSRREALCRYRDDGRAELDNNAAKRALRAAALGRENWLFAGSDDGGERGAAIYSLLGSAKLNDLDPEAYLRHRQVAL